MSLMKGKCSLDIKVDKQGPVSSRSSNLTSWLALNWHALPREEAFLNSLDIPLD